MIGLDFKSAIHIFLLPRLGVRSNPLVGRLGHVGAVPSAMGINQDPRVCTGEVPTDHQELYICIDCVAHIVTQPALSQGSPPPAVLDLNSRMSPSESGSKFYLDGGKEGPLVAGVTGQALLRKKCKDPSRGHA